MTGPRKFFAQGVSGDATYVNVRDDDDLYEARKFTEQLWNDYAHLADLHFLSDAPNHFHQRFWEMYLACTFQARGLELHRVGGEGPEFYVVSEGRRLWVEAVAPTAGEGVDRVEEISVDAMTYVPSEQIILRFTSVLRDKLKKFNLAVAKGIVRPGEQLVLAINSRGIPFAPYFAEMPYIMKAVLPLGALTFTISKDTSALGPPTFQYRPEVFKSNRAPVSTAAFLNPDFAAIAAVVHSAVDPANRPEKLGEEFVVLHNPSTSPKLSESLFEWCKQFVWSEQTLRELARGKV